MAGGAGEALVIRPSTPDDLEGFHACLDVVARERRWLGLLEAPPLEEARAFLEGARARGMVQLLALRGTRVVGFCDAGPDARPGFGHGARLGMGLLPEERGRGLGRRLLEGVLAETDRLGLWRVELEVFASNAPAIALYERTGFVHEGRRRAGRVLDGRVEDVLLMGRLGPGAPPEAALSGR